MSVILYKLLPALSSFRRGRMHTKPLPDPAQCLAKRGFAAFDSVSVLQVPAFRFFADAHELLVAARLPDQLGMGALFHDAAVIHHQANGKRANCNGKTE